MSARGRPRHEGERTASGRLREREDFGTPELLIQRAVSIKPALAVLPVADILAHGKVDLGGKHRLTCQDPCASYPLGVLFAQGLITSQQHWAGKRYLGLYTRAVRPVGVASVLGTLAGSSGGSGNPEPSQVDEKYRSAFLAAKAALLARGRFATSVVERVAVFDLVLQSEPMIKVLRAGLDALVVHFESAKEAAE